MPASLQVRPAATRVVSRFLVVGVVATVVDVVLFNLARQLLEAGPLTSKTLAFVVSASIAFAGNRLWVFDQRQQRQLAAAYALFLAINVAGLVVNLVPLAISTYALGLTSPLAENISANVVGLALATLFRFWAYQRWVFPRGGAETGGGETAVPR
jgi:putative flippase GtrA